jgi:hypothetical protein
LVLRYALNILLVLLVSGCAVPQSVPPTVEQATVNQRLDELERRVQRLEGRPVVEMPYRGREEVQAHIKSLEAERARLLVKYTDQHPAVKDIDRRLLILNEQLRKLEP